MKSPRFFIPVLFLGLLISSSCGEDEKPLVTVEVDAAIPDAAPPPDAEICTQTDCGGLCIDTTSDSLNCGGCGLACASAGQICSGALPCACPTPFIPAELTGTVQAQQGTLLGLTLVIGATFDLVTVVYDLTVEVGVEYNLADSVASLSPPAVAAGYDVDTTNLTAHTAYAGVSGTIIFDTVCETGASGTISAVNFAEVAGITNPTPVEGGCSMTATELPFSYGSCPVLGDAGVADDAGPADAGI